MPSQSDLDKTYLEMARVWSSLSHAVRRKVGCVVVKGGQIISDGYNGTPHGFDNSCEAQSEGELYTKPEVIHAESNALMKLARSTQSSNGSTVYITVSPCFECSKLMIQGGVERVVYGDLYRNTDGLDILRQSGVEIVQLIDSPV